MKIKVITCKHCGAAIKLTGGAWNGYVPDYGLDCPTALSGAHEPQATEVEKE